MRHKLVDLLNEFRALESHETYYATGFLHGAAWLLLIVMSTALLRFKWRRGIDDRLDYSAANAPTAVSRSSISSLIAISVESMLANVRLISFRVAA